MELRFLSDGVKWPFKRILHLKGKKHIGLTPNQVYILEIKLFPAEG